MNYAKREAKRVNKSNNSWIVTAGRTFFARNRSFFATKSFNSGPKGGRFAPSPPHFGRGNEAKQSLVPVGVRKKSEPTRCEILLFWIGT